MLHFDFVFNFHCYIYTFMYIFILLYNSFFVCVLLATSVLPVATKYSSFNNNCNYYSSIKMLRQCDEKRANILRNFVRVAGD